MHKTFTRVGLWDFISWKNPAALIALKFLFIVLSTTLSHPRKSYKIVVPEAVGTNSVASCKKYSDCLHLIFRQIL